MENQRTALHCRLKGVVADEIVAFQSTVEFYTKRGFRLVKKYTEMWGSAALDLRKLLGNTSQ